MPHHGKFLTAHWFGLIVQCFRRKAVAWRAPSGFSAVSWFFLPSTALLRAKRRKTLFFSCLRKFMEVVCK